MKCSDRLALIVIGIILIRRGGRGFRRPRHANDDQVRAGWGQVPGTYDDVPKLKYRSPKPGPLRGRLGAFL
jgi:hypothetical protein